MDKEKKEAMIGLLQMVIAAAAGSVVAMSAWCLSQ